MRLFFSHLRHALAGDGLDLVNRLACTLCVLGLMGAAGLLAGLMVSRLRRAGAAAR